MTFEINLDWMEPWSSQADEYVANGTKLRKIAVEAENWDEAKKKALDFMTDEERDDYLRSQAGVL
jgi:hypothetical protein